MNIKQLITGLGLSCALVLSACDKVIDVEPEYVKDGSQIFTTLDDYEYALTGAYSLFRQVGYYGNGGQTAGTWSVLPDMMSDNLVRTGADLGNWQTQTDFLYSADESDIEIAWLAAYSVISQANLVLRNIEQFSETDAQRVNRIKGQALAIRGMVHFDLLRYWGESFDRNSTGLGVPYKKEVNIEDMPSRLAVKETYDNIFADLEEAERLLGDVDMFINEGDRARIDQLATRALLARVNLYAKNYGAAESYATMVIEAMPLADRDEFPLIWKDASIDEVIWSVTFSAGEGSPSSGVHAGSGNRNRFRPSSEVLNTYDQENDIRFPSYFATREEGFGTPFYPGATNTDIGRWIVSKFLTRSTTLDNLVDWKVLRTGEMYLIRAEARAVSGANEAGALVDLNTLRAARIEGYMPELLLTGQALIDEIALERRKELFAEGHRWFDLKRTSRTLNRAGDQDLLESTTVELAPGAREWVWPIPTVEIVANPNIRGQQSPNY
jgi:hypothetical protein